MLATVLNQDSTVSANADQLSSKLGDEVVILNLQSGVYYGLDPVGARVWELAQTNQTFSNICQAVVDEFEVEPQQCERDVSDLLREMQAQGLVQIAASNS
jgi:hypothetical protein